MDYITAVTMLRNSPNDASGIAEACKILERARERVVENVADLQLEVWVTVALADGLMMTKAEDEESEQERQHV
jgi:hypothetical protein